MKYPLRSRPLLKRLLHPIDHDQDASAKYPLSGIPKTYLIDSEGYIVYECPGAIKEDYLDQNIPNLR